MPGVGAGGTPNLSHLKNIYDGIANLSASVGSLETLATKETGSVVGAINETFSRPGVINGTVYAADYGIVGDYASTGSPGTDDAPALQACLDAASALAIMHSTTHRIGVKVPPGKYRIHAKQKSDAYLRVPYNVDLDMEGAELYYTNTDYTSTILMLGDDTQMARTPFHKGISVISRTGIGLSPAETESFVLVQVNAMDAGYVSFGRVLGNAGIAIQLKPGQTSINHHIAYSHFFLSLLYQGLKTCIDLHPNESAWVNNNYFYGANIQPQESQHLGSLAGLRFSRSGTLETPHTNIFYGPCFQMGRNASGQGPLKVGTGGVSSAVAKYWYVNYDLATPRQYYCSNGGGTVGTAPTHTDGGAYVGAGGVAEFTDMGPFFRVPVFHDKVGTQNQIRHARFESGVGGFVLVRNAPTSESKYPLQGNYHIAGFFDFYNDALDRSEVDCSLLNAGAGLRQEMDIDIITHQTSVPRVVEFRDIHRTAIISQDVHDTGTATGGSSTTLVDATGGWTTDQWHDKWVRILSGTGAGQSRPITSNTSTTLTVNTAHDLSGDWLTSPSTDSVYEIYDPYLMVKGWQFWTMNTATAAPKMANYWNRILKGSLFYNQYPIIPCVVLDSRRRNIGLARHNKRYFITSTRLVGSTSGIIVVPLDEFNNRVATLSGATYQASTAVVTSAVSNDAIFAGWESYINGNDYMSFGYGTNTNVKKFLVGPAYNTSYIKDVSLRAFAEGCEDQVLVSTNYDPDSLNAIRKSYGTPMIGFFENVGERIVNSDVSGGPQYWTVKLAWHLFPQWLANETDLLVGDIRTTGGRAYARTVSGTCSGTAPTHTTVGQITDNWECLGVGSQDYTDCLVASSDTW